jgi:SNF2 family DNA or RNA helicase
LQALEEEAAEAEAALPRLTGSGLLYSRATLVVCAVSLVGQWMDEAVDKTKTHGSSSLKLFKYHGPSRDKVRSRLVSWTTHHAARASRYT